MKVFSLFLPQSLSLFKKDLWDQREKELLIKIISKKFQTGCKLFRLNRIKIDKEQIIPFTILKIMR